MEMKTTPAHIITRKCTSGSVGAAVLAGGVAGRGAYAPPGLVYNGDLSRRLTPPVGGNLDRNQASKFDAHLHRGATSTRNARQRRLGSRNARHQGYLAKARGTRSDA